MLRFCEIIFTYLINLSMIFSSIKQNPDRARELRHWQNTGGVLIIGYEMFRNLSCEGKKFRPKMRKDFQETLVDPGTLSF